MSETQQRYELALEELVADFRRDTQIVAAILIGSLSHDVVWEKSDIDLMLVTGDAKLQQDMVSLLKHDVIVHASIVTRSQFRKLTGSAMQSSFMHSTLTRGKVLFSRDPMVDEFFAQTDPMGARDRQARLLDASIPILPTLTKAEKWLNAKRDYKYAAFYVGMMTQSLATLEVVQASGNPGREVVHQAIALNPGFFNSIYTGFADVPKTEENVRRAVDAINDYLLTRARLLFAPVFDYLDSAGSVRTASEIDHHFANQMDVNCVSAVCEWLSDHSLIQRVGVSCRLTDKSRVDFEAAGFYYDRTFASDAP